MSGARQSGFTIVELTLFLAISGLLFLVVLIGTGSTIRSIRFTDSVRTFAAYVQKQYDNIINGVNSRPNNVACNSGSVSSGSQAAGTSNCLVMGALLVTDTGSNQIRAYTIIGNEPAGADYNQKDEDLIRSFQPRPVTIGDTPIYDIAWGAYVSGHKRAGDNKATNAVALIRSPRSTRIVQYTFKTTEVDISNLPNIVNQPTVNMNKPLAICIKNADGLGAPAKITIGDAPNQTAVQTAFDQSEGDCNGS